MQKKLVLVAKEVMVLRGMLERLTEVVRRYGIERNVEETKVMKISRQPPLPYRLWQNRCSTAKRNFHQ